MPTGKAVIGATGVTGNGAGVGLTIGAREAGTLDGAAVGGITVGEGVDAVQADSISVNASSAPHRRIGYFIVKVSLFLCVLCDLSGSNKPSRYRAYTKEML